MISEDGEGMFSPTQIVPPVDKSFHHGKQFSLVDIIVVLRGGKGGRVVCDGVKLGFSLFVQRGVSCTSFLGEYCSDPVCGGVGL